MERLGKAVDSLSSKYENFLIIGDFNAQASDTSVKDFCDVYSFKHLINEPTCYKSPNNLKCLDLMLINRQHSFQNSCVIDTRLSDFYKMTVTVLRLYFLKAEPKMYCIGTINNFQIMNLDRLLTQIMEIYRILTILL